MIDLTPLDVRKKKGDFTKGLRGYDPVAVDQFLELVAERMEELLRSNATLAERATQATNALGAYREREQAMNEALVAAHQLREDQRTQSAREAEQVLQQARVEAERIVGEARKTAQEAAEATRRVYHARARFLKGYRAFLERQLEDVATEEDRVRDVLPPLRGDAENGLKPEDEIPMEGPAPA